MVSKTQTADGAAHMMGQSQPDWEAFNVFNGQWAGQRTDLPERAPNEISLGLHIALA